MISFFSFPHVRNLRSKKIHRHIRQFLVLSVFLISGCSHPPSEEGLRTNVAEIQQAISERNNGDVMQHVSTLFSGRSEVAGGSGYRLDRKGLRKLLTGYFLRYQQLEVVITSMEVEIHDGVEATVSGKALLLGMNNILPEDGRVFNFDSTWLVEEGDWRVVELTWR